MPGSVSGVLSGRDVAYAIRADAGQSFDIGLSSGSFDAMLRLYDGSCGRAIASDDDGGTGTNARIQWTPSAGGDYVVVVSSIQRSGRGSYELTVSTDRTARVLTEAEKQSVQAFAQWVKSASDDDILAAWRGAGSPDLQLGCLSQARFESAAIRRAGAMEDALSTCMGGLKRATDARKEMLAAQKQVP